MVKDPLNVLRRYYTHKEDEFPPEGNGYLLVCVVIELERRIKDLEKKLAEIIK